MNDINEMMQEALTLINEYGENVLSEHKVDLSLRHIDESNLPPGAKTLIRRQLLAGFDQEDTGMNAPQERDNQKSQKSNVVNFPTRANREGEREGVVPFEVAIKFVKQWGEPLNAWQLHGIARVMQKHCTAVNGVEFLKLTKGDVYTTHNAGLKTWHAIRRIQEKMRT